VLLQWFSVLALGVLHCEAFCPQGFGGDGDFPEEWKIPRWPSMDLEMASKLRTVTLGGFKMKSINEEYLEGPGEGFQMQGRETYWQASGKFFMYFCERFTKWRIAEISAFSKNMEGNCFAFVSDAYPGRDILNTTLIKGWIEVDNGEWQVREAAGVMQVGTLADQIAKQEEGDEDEEGVEESNCTTDDKDTSSCPVMPHVRKARDKVVSAAHAAGKWVRRLFPKHLGAPDEEDSIPDADNPLFAEDPDATPYDCQPDTQDGCNFKEKFYLMKQIDSTVEKRKGELMRLVKMKDVVMKPDQVKWLMARTHILKHLVQKDDTRGDDL